MKAPSERTRRHLAASAEREHERLDAWVEQLDLDLPICLADQLVRVRPLDRIVAWCKAHQPHEPPSSPRGAAIRYLLNHQLPLRHFLDDGRVPIDNGIVERLHIRAALAWKNLLFAGSDAGAERATIAYTVLGGCELADVNPVEYLADVLPRLARRVRLRDVPALLPARWKAARAAGAAATSAAGA